MKNLIIGIIVGCVLAVPQILADKISTPPPLRDTWEDAGPAVQHYLQEISNNFHRLPVTTTTPNTNRKGLKGEMVIFNDSGTFKLFINTDSNKAWQQI